MAVLTWLESAELYAVVLGMETRSTMDPTKAASCDKKDSKARALIIPILGSEAETHDMAFTTKRGSDVSIE